MNFTCPLADGDGYSVAVSLSGHLLLLYGGNLFCVCVCVCIFNGAFNCVMGGKGGTFVFGLIGVSNICVCVSLID